MENQETEETKSIRESSHRRIEDYDSEWPQMYEKEKKTITDTIGDEILEIENIGSTAVPGLAAKPIIDIAVLIESHEEAEELIEKLKTIGYEFNKEKHDEFNPDGKSERHFLRKGTPYMYHLSIAYKDRGGFWDRQLIFRNFLRNNKEYRDKYGELKKKLIKKDPTGTDSYIGEKTELITEILEKAGFNVEE